MGDDNGFEAWGQLNLTFEPELEAQKNTVLLELHSILAATSIEETKNKIVELNARIARAEDILRTQILEMQNKNALLQVSDPITKQHTATRKVGDFNSFYTVVMHLTNNISIGCGLTANPNVNGVNGKESYDVNCEEAPDVQGRIDVVIFVDNLVMDR